MSRKNIDDVRRRLAAFENAYNREDLDAVLSVWAPQFVDIPDWKPALRGPAAHARRREAISARFREYAGQLRIEPTEFAALGYTAVLVHGRLTVTLRHRRTNAMSYVRKRFMEVWVREAAGWVIQFEMANGEP